MAGEDRASGDLHPRYGVEPAALAPSAADFVHVQLHLQAGYGDVDGLVVKQWSNGGQTAVS
jgi:hypothetical protein